MRKPTKNTSAVFGRELSSRLRREFAGALEDMPDADKLLLVDVLTFYNGGTSGIGLASAFEMTLHSMLLVVLYESEYRALCERLEKAEAFQKKVLFMPARETAA